MAILAGAGSSCAFRAQTTRMAVDYNDFVAQTTNRQTIVNVLRASQREPMHFTSFSEVVGTIRSTGVVSSNAAVNGDTTSETRTATTTANSTATGANGGAVTNTLTNVATEGATNVTPNLSLTVATGTDFKVAANATDEFYRGILNPISPAILVNYLRQGFPPDLLSHLAIGRLEFRARVTGPDGKPRLIDLMAVENNPDTPAKIALFDAAIRCRTLDYAMSTSRKAPIEAATLEALGTLTPDQLARVESVRDDKGALSYRIGFPERTDFSLALSKPNNEQCLRTRLALMGKFEVWKRDFPELKTPTAAPPPTPSFADKLFSFDRRNADRDDEGRSRIGSSSVQLGGENYFTHLLPKGYQGDLVIDVTLRSVEGMLYYLGEYIRPEKAPVLLKSDDCGGQYCAPILRVRPKAEIPSDQRFVAVEYRGKVYAAPISGSRINGEYGRSSQTISLMQQLLNLNRSAKDLPSTPLVRVYN